MQQKWQCRVAASLGGGFAGIPEDVWDVKPYENNTDPTVFFGLYGLPDFYHLWRHKGRRAILWAGSDIRHFKNGYWLDENGTFRLPSNSIGRWINKYCENYVENVVEQTALKRMGIDTKVIPSFLGDVDNYDVCYKPSRRTKLYASVSGDDFKLYKWDQIEELAAKHPDIQFHLYGNKTEWHSKNNNVVVHGRVPQEIMNDEIKEMQGGLRLLDFDGCSEIIVKSILWGQWPVSAILYPGTLSVNEIGTLKDRKEPNHKGRKWFLENLNRYPWGKHV